MPKMGSHCSFEHLKHKSWPKEGAGSRNANLTPDQKKSGIDPIYLAADDVPHTVGQLSMRATTLGFACKVMGLQSLGSPDWRDFGTPTRESRERKTIWMWAPWRGAKYTIRGKVVASPKSGPW
jgi:hypothetical protein